MRTAAADCKFEKAEIDAAQKTVALTGKNRCSALKFVVAI
jgi:hypothetical protein